MLQEPGLHTTIVRRTTTPDDKIGSGILILRKPAALDYFGTVLRTGTEAALIGREKAWSPILTYSDVATSAFLRAPTPIWHGYKTIEKLNLAPVGMYIHCCWPVRLTTGRPATRP